MHAFTRVNKRLFLVMAVVILTTGGVAVANDQFSDVPPGGFHDDISWMKANAITLGCTPTLYCPNANVTRGQMAAFMHRLNNNAVWSQEGNAATTSTDFLGTLDNNRLELRVNNTVAQRIFPTSGTPNIIGGFSGNTATVGVVGAFIGGGGLTSYANEVTGTYGTIGGGWGNAAGIFSIVGGGDSNSATGYAATVAGGFVNSASDVVATVGGGQQNFAGYAATVGGGVFNSAAGSGATVAGGDTNSAGAYAAVGGGILNSATGSGAAIGGGDTNSAGGNGSTVIGGTGNSAGGLLSTVAGGNSNQAAGNYSLAAGRRALAINAGSFVWGDSSNFDVGSTAINEFTVRAVGGARFISAIDGTGVATAGVTLATGGGAWESLSDRNSKENLEVVDGLDILDRLMLIPIGTWNYKTQDDAIRHMGPMAQDFYAAFQLGESDTRISTIDADGVALAAVQGLNQKLNQKVLDLEARLARLESLVGSTQEPRCPVA